MCIKVDTGITVDTGGGKGLMRDTRGSTHPGILTYSHVTASFMKGSLDDVITKQEFSEARNNLAQLVHGAH